MKDTRSRVLAAIRQGLGRGELGTAMRDTLEARLRGNTVSPNEQPRLPEMALDAVFRERVEQAAGTHETCRDLAEVPSRVAAYRERQALGGPLAVAPSLQMLAWSDTGLKPRFGRTDGGDSLCVSQAFCAIAETGSLVLLSGPENPTSLNFLPDHHLVVLKAADVVPYLEDAWKRLRARDSVWPRSVNLVTGPSRTADVEQTIQLGAHGPRRLHVLLIR